MINDITQLDAQAQPIDDAAEARLDEHIQWLGKMIMLSRQRGTDSHVFWLDRQNVYIASRTPAHQARLESEHLARVEGQQCFFDVCGEADAKRLGEGAC